MRRIPKSFQLMGHTITVQVIDKKDWKIEDASGYFDPDKNQILLLKQPRTQLRHTYWHEVTHAILYVMGHKLYGNESFVDQVGGLLAQIMDTAEF